jgi:glutamine---fructose-6-phosphate transaminase (isomerizing)
MCGIFGYIGNKTNAAQLVVSGLKTLEYRGYDSWGVACAVKHQIFVSKHTGQIGKSHNLVFPKSTFAFGHTRWATHGGVSDANAHPHLDCTGKIALIHNGIIENYLEIKKRMLKLGHTFHSETDTEVAVHLIEEYAKKFLISKSVQLAFNEIKGLNAFIVMDAQEERFVIARNGSPLVVGYGDGENFIASDAIALLPYTRQVYFLEENQMAYVSRAGIMIFDAISGDLVEINKQQLDWTVEQAVKGKYTHFMQKEIHEQPAILADITANYTKQAIRIAEIIKNAYGTYMVGCGTAAHACLAGTYIFSKVAKRHINWAIGSEFSYQLEFLTPKSLVIALSQSGETMDTIEAVKRSKEKGARIFALVNQIGSSLYRIADDKMLLGAGPETGVASTKAFTAKLAHLIMLAYAMAGKIHEGQKILSHATRSTQKILTDTSVKRIETLANKLAKSRDIYLFGRGFSYPVALESALKIKEISYIHAEGIAAGELKHGPLALVSKGTPCIIFLPYDETYGAMLAAADELKARGATIIGVSYKNNPIFDEFIPVLEAGIGTIIPHVVVGQLLAYYMAVSRKLDPDKPRNLAKSVTVK